MKSGLLHVHGADDTGFHNDKGRMIEDLIYDVGMNDGDDTAYYLARGYRVVAVEADPTLVDDARKRFEREIAAGRLTIVNCAVGPQNGRAKFWISPDNRVWNSFYQSVAARNGAKHYAVDLEVRSFADVLAQHGVPFYLKIDIEGYDIHCLQAIDPANRPGFVSWELGSIEELGVARSKGYNAFKCISQNTHGELRLGSRRGTQFLPPAFRLKRSARGALLRTPGVVPVAKALRRAIKGSPESSGSVHRGAPVISSVAWANAAPASGPGKWEFRYGSSGPFGNDLPGDWKTPEEIEYQYLDLILNASPDKPRYLDDWFDVHATTLDNPPRLQVDPVSE